MTTPEFLESVKGPRREWWIVDGREGYRLFDDEHEAILYAGRLAEDDPTFTIHVVEHSTDLSKLCRMLERAMGALEIYSGIGAIADEARLARQDIDAIAGER